ncbi:MAG: YbgA family protein [Desulfovibrionales bacterium]
MKIGISSCLLGHKVRYDGGHKLDRFLANTLGAFVTFVPVCPEVESGLPIPREALRLVGDPSRPRLVTSKTNQEYTSRMESWGRKRLIELEGEDLCGFIFKSRSPSSGMARVKVYNDQGIPSGNGVGVWAGLFMEHFPCVPVEDDGRLHDPKIRENFIERIFVMQSWREMVSRRKTLQSLIQFHTRHKLLLMAHNPKHYRELGKLVASGKAHDTDTLFAQYFTQFATALKLTATVKKNRNVLLHILGYFKKHLEPGEKQEMLSLIDHYAQADIPLIVPITMFNHFVLKYQQEYLMDQVYLNPHPLELKLRNHV